MKNNTKNNQNNLFISKEITNKYNFTASWLFSNLSFHISRSGYFDTSVSWVKSVENRTGISRNTQYYYLNKFIEDGLLVLTGTKYTFNNDNVIFDDVFVAYKNAFKSGFNEITTISLIEVDIASCDESKMIGKKAEHERACVTLAAWLRDRTASNFVFNDEQDSTSIKSITWLAKTFNVAWITCKRILTSITSIKNIFSSYKCKISNSIIFSPTSWSEKILTKKRAKFTKKRRDNFSQKYQTKPQ